VTVSNQISLNGSLKKKEESPKLEDRGGTHRTRPKIVLEKPSIRKLKRMQVDINNNNLRGKSCVPARGSSRNVGIHPQRNRKEVGFQFRSAR